MDKNSDREMIKDGENNYFAIKLVISGWEFPLKRTISLGTGSFILNEELQQSTKKT